MIQYQYIFYFKKRKLFLIFMNFLLKIKNKEI
jgi:hypothetical protein